MNETVVSRVKRLAREPWTIAALATTAVGTALRLLELTRFSLLDDELATLWFTSRGVMGSITASAADTQPPLFYVLIAGLGSLFGASELTLRLPSALFGAIGVWLTYLVGARLASKSAGVFAAILYAVSFRALWFAQFARPYTMAVVMVLVAALTLLRALDRPTVGRIALHVVAVVAACYTHLFALIACAGLELAVLLVPRLRRRLGVPFYVGCVASVLAYVPWLYVLLQQASRVAMASSEGVWLLKPPGNVLAAAGRALLYYIPWLAWESKPRVVPGLLALAAAGALAAIEVVGAWRSRAAAPEEEAETGGDEAERFPLSRLERLWVLSGWFGMVFFGGLLVSKFVLPIFSWKYAFVAVPAFYIVCSSGMVRLKRPVAAAVLVAVLLPGVVGLPWFYTQRDAKDWRGAVAYLLDKNPDRGPYVGTVGQVAWVPPYVSGYAELLTGEPYSRCIEVGGAESDAVTDQRLRAALVGRDSIYAFVTNVPLDDRRFSVADRSMLRIGWGMDTQQEFNGIIVRRYVRRGGGD